jgi:predicted metal-dependent hydrolase
MTALTVGDLRFEVRRSARRRSVQITVDRDGALILAAPTGCSVQAMEDFVREKRVWIYTRLAEKEALRPPAPAKEYVSGEGFPYLGRSHRLLLVGAQDVPVKLTGGRFRMRRADAVAGRAHMIRWYTEHARPWLTRCVASFAGRVDVRPAGIVVHELGHRWGSCGKGGTLNFHWKTILLPPHAIEYVVVHELVHLIEPHHTPGFWQRVGRTLPDYAARQQWLAEHGHALVEV